MKDRYKELEQFQGTLNLKFNVLENLNIALTHSSFVNGKKGIQYYERYEFLGDAILQLVITEYLFKNFNKKTEGELTRIRSLIVCENSLHSIAQKWNLGTYIRMSKGEEITGGRERISILADCVEAVIAALYLDKGLEETKEFIIQNFKDTISDAINDKIVLDYKTRLQETLQEKGDVEIKYFLVKHEGPPHRRKFFSEVSVEGDVFGNGEGFSKKESEQNAAKQALCKILEVKNG